MIWPAAQQLSLPELEQSASFQNLRDSESMKHEARRKEYLASRYLSLAVTSEAVQSSDYGEPLWPHPLKGSITHKNGHVALMVAQSDDPLGIDLEVCKTYSDGFDAKVMGQDELDLIHQLPFGVSAIFSAKESIYKAFFPLVRRKFWFDAAQLLNVAFADDHGILDFQITQNLSLNVVAGRRVRVHAALQQIEGKYYWLTYCSSGLCYR